LLKLNIEKARIDEAKRYAREITESFKDLLENYSSVTIERTVVRLFGIDGALPNGEPLPNVVVEHLQTRNALERGAAYWLANGVLSLDINVQQLAEKIADGEIDLTLLPAQTPEKIYVVMESFVDEMLKRIKKQRQFREDTIARLGKRKQPAIYVIVATGNIYEDVIQAKASARQGADIIAVIRSTAQSLLDYVPYGATTKGFGGTYATQENFRIMRKALDEVGEEIGKYISLTNYASGLCMPEIAAMGAMERLDIMLNDAMYGILFRDINMKRTFLDQYFSRMINAYAGIEIQTGEDNYLTTSDAIESAYTVTASQLINEQFALLSGLKPDKMGIGHAFEIDPAVENSVLYEIAQALLTKTLLPESPVKYMPPTKHVTGNVYKTYLLNGIFNLVSQVTGQGVQLLGMMTEAIHTPYMIDRALAIENAQYVFKGVRDLGEELKLREEGFINERANHVLGETIEFLSYLKEEGLMAALAEGKFANIKRNEFSGKGLDGVFLKATDYVNPFMDKMKAELGMTENPTGMTSLGISGVSSVLDKVETSRIPPTEETSEASVPQKKTIKPYGDTLNDGRMQLSFTLPAPANEKGKEAAKLIMKQMGLEEIEVCHLQDLSGGFTHFIAYATCNVSVNLEDIKVTTVEIPTLGMDEIDDYIEKEIGKKLTVVGACIESDAHTVGIDAIMNMKGYSGHYGLERYRCFETYNMGAQVPVEELLNKAREVKADAILVSQVVTQKNIHIKNLTKLIELSEAEGLRNNMLFICGGPRINHELAIELGYDAGFGSGTFAANVAYFIAQQIAEKSNL